MHRKCGPCHNVNQTDLNVTNVDKQELFTAAVYSGELILISNEWRLNSHLGMCPVCCNGAFTVLRTPFTQKILEFKLIRCSCT